MKHGVRAYVERLLSIAVCDTALAPQSDSLFWYVSTKETLDETSQLSPHFLSRNAKASFSTH